MELKDAATQKIRRSREGTPAWNVLSGLAGLAVTGDSGGFYFLSLLLAASGTAGHFNEALFIDSEALCGDDIALLDEVLDLLGAASASSETWIRPSLPGQHFHDRTEYSNNFLKFEMMNGSLHET